METKLGECYHENVTYSLGYEACDRIELRGKTFTCLHFAEAALKEHQRNFDPNRDIPLFIVSLKPEKIIGRENINRIRIAGMVINHYEQIIEMSDGELTKFRGHLCSAKSVGDKAIDNFLSDSFADNEVVDSDSVEWSAELIDGDDKVIDHLDS